MRLPEREIRVAAAGPMTQRHRRRYARLAGMNGLAELRRRAAQVENVDFESGARLEGLSRDLDQAPRLRHFAGTRVLGAGRAIDDEDARGACRIIMTTSGVVDGIARGQPVDRNLIVGIGETGAGLAGDRRLSTVVIGVPRRIGDGLQLALQRREDRIHEGGLETLLESPAPQTAGRHPLAHVRLEHGGTPEKPGRAGCLIHQRGEEGNGAAFVPSAPLFNRLGRRY